MVHSNNFKLYCLGCPPEFMFGVVADFFLYTFMYTGFISVYQRTRYFPAQFLIFVLIIHLGEFDIHSNLGKASIAGHLIVPMLKMNCTLTSLFSTLLNWVGSNTFSSEDLKNLGELNSNDLHGNSTLENTEDNFVIWVEWPFEALVASISWEFISSISVCDKWSWLAC